ncbi:MAG: DUF1679 domain-containing protein [SAR202 cluster bacterium]|jgi:hypothetical protein|nr:hypothetical protein [Chloroflexota bacterium]MDP6422384.1 DUF1679 domain-containing protein [SAR202 cluster bacterium]HAL48026.1 hypothetical protein [Dehalococcoidia bacterium]MDP6663536.1 DUF1679 domain-containing protein [SAR202 cluster bacterium]MDP6800779.1 DUF1679 domain-containing protein [SAR202 cluster bacterium]|tara:strand:+ start:9801 stop:10880 length:1080 start_codon:yes stop_codon:yes gene_type:complete
MEPIADPPLPRTIDDITPEWLTSALATGGVLTGALVTSVEIERIGLMDGFMGVIARLTPQYDAPTDDLPSTLIAKLPDADPVQRSAQSSAFTTEAGYYSTFPGDDSTVHPRCYFVGSDPNGDDYAFLIEDLSNGRSASMIRHMPLNDAATVFRTLAGLHAKRWNASQLDRLSWAVDGRTREAWAPAQELYEATWDEFSDKWGGYFSTEIFEIAERLKTSIVDVLTVPAGSPVTLTHGDTRPENMFFSDENPNRDLALIDWQRATIQPGAWDLAYFVEFSLDPDDRRSAERELLRSYMDRLKTDGVVDFTTEELHTDYRRDLLTPLIRMIPTGSRIDPDLPQVKDVVQTMLSRLDALADW